ncbi:hypothetical protein HYFRA_00007200 [Hymenoscyphus fraxineus]|uniref:PHD-type domain-containing protein n=1 Tax=Hymenoscyphus fraxineus TaxID=746836 RepID=A0A9N9KWJ4_9HELO|nr:hypothetical protein HYFRA_00007200 [Hymenoscyphus fraxineus]
MSWEQQAYSFGNPNAQIATPTQTPTSAQFPSPTFRTPRNNSSSFEDRSGWTPQFAEEYSVFNSTPGRLTGAQQSSFVEAPTPHAPINTGQPQLSGTEDIAAELSTHVHHLSPNPNIALPPVDPLNQLPSSPGPYSTTHSRFDDSSKQRVTPRKPKKRLEEAFSGQTATPPATVSRGARKLAPKIQTDIMQNDSRDGQYGSQQTPTHSNHMMAFPSTSAEFFGYPMSAPTTAPLYTNSKPFWEQDTSMGGMGMDFGNDDAAMFSTGGHKMNNSFDWGNSNPMFQDSVNLSSTQPEPRSQAQSQAQALQAPATSRRQRPLAPKMSHPLPDLASSMAPFDFNSTSTSEDPFAIGVDAVDPGLLFSRTATNMASNFEDVSLPRPRPITSHDMPLEPYQHQSREASRDHEDLRRSRSSRDHGAGNDRSIASSPVKGSARLGLQRSVSDSRIRRPQDRVKTRNGRVSPVKQQRPPSLSSIPELPASRARTEVRFTIDSKGRARTETVVIQEEPRSRPTSSRPASSSRSRDRYDYTSSESSSDEEPIIVPSRNNSFTIPPPQKAPRLARFETLHHDKDPRRRNTGGYSQSESSSQRSLQFDGFESEAETVMDEDDGSGDATLAMRQLVENRKRAQIAKSRTPRHHRYSTHDPRANPNYTGYGSSNISPVTTVDSATPTSSRSVTRCVCNNPDSEGFQIQCESCDNWLHAECVGIDERSLPPVYICAFCANTPNIRGGRLRETARLGSSPLAHKSFKMFR